jgi:hypothetical protein
MLRTIVALLVCIAALLPTPALAHDDPVLTVRVLSQGITDGQIDTAMGELDDNATIDVDTPVSGRQQIIAWIQQQLTLNLRIEVIDITPTQTADGYDVTWTTHMYREDWRKAGVPMRQTTEHASIHNGRVTQWTSSLATQLASGGAAANARQASNAPAATGGRAGVPSAAGGANVASRPTVASGPRVAGVPLSDIPIGLVALVLLVVAVGAWLSLSTLRRPRTRRGTRPVATIESLAPRAADRKP